MGEKNVLRDPSGVPVFTGSGGAAKNSGGQDWQIDSGMEYDANRYDPDRPNEGCLVCGDRLTHNAWDTAQCPTCNKTVYLV